MTNKKKLIALYHSTWTLLAVCIIFMVLFCIFPTEMWMIPIFAIAFVGFPICYIFYKNHKYDWDKE